MPGSSTIPRGNVAYEFILQAALTPASVATITAPEQTFTVNGLQLGDFVQVQKPTAQAGLGIAGSRVSAANTLGITYVNPTVGAIVPTAETYLIRVTRPENAGSQPTAIA